MKRDPFAGRRDVMAEIWDDYFKRHPKGPFGPRRVRKGRRAQQQARAVRQQRIEARSRILDLERGATYRTKAQAAKALGVTVAEVERQLAICWLVRLVLPAGFP